VEIQRVSPLVKQFPFWHSETVHMVAAAIAAGQSYF